MNKAETKDNRVNERAPYRARLPAFLSDKDVYIGDVIKQVTHAFGIKPCSGCERRAAALNRWLVFSRRPK
ncbi:MAG TPA: hypothetical protein VF088_19050 [Pyrinomonadaceae bacterium]